MQHERLPGLPHSMLTTRVRRTIFADIRSYPARKIVQTMQAGGAASVARVGCRGWLQQGVVAPHWMHFTVQAPAKPTSLQEGDEVLLYQTVKPNSKEQPGLTALCCVASAPYPDPSKRDLLTSLHGSGVGGEAIWEAIMHDVGSPAHVNLHRTLLRGIRALPPSK